jgi:hypothetical protein
VNEGPATKKECVMGSLFFKAGSSPRETGRAKSGRARQREEIVMRMEVSVERRN